jgi:hypothetical protein
MHAQEWEQKHPDQAKAMDGNELKNAGSNSEQAKTFDDQFPQGTPMARKVAFPPGNTRSRYAFLHSAMIVSFRKAGQAPDGDRSKRSSASLHRSHLLEKTETRWPNATTALLAA